MTTTTAIIFDHRNRAKEGQKGLIEIRITTNRKSYYFSTGIKVEKKYFVSGMIVNCPGATELNERLAIVYKKVNSIVNEDLEAGREINTISIRNRVWQVVETHSAEPVVLKWIEEQMPMLDVSEGTLVHYKTLLLRLTEFGQLSHWDDYTTEGIYKFDAYLHSLHKPQSDAAIKAGRPKEKLSDAAIYNYHKCLKAILNRAVRFGKLDRNPYELLKRQFKRGDVERTEFLTEDEIARIHNAEGIVPGSALDIARDLFVFQIYTGLSYSDMQAFDFSLYKCVDGEWVHTGRRIKTGVPYVSVLMPPAINVLQKYGGSIPQMNNADYNHSLKALGAIAGITTRLHSHLARHTFATRMLAMGARIENVSQMLGHTNIRQTQRYSKVLAESVRNDFKKVIEAISEKSKPSELHSGEGVQEKY